MQRHLPFIFFALGIILASFCGYKIYHQAPKLTQNEIARTKVYTLRSSQGMCTGVAVKANSGKSFILTAGHCKGLVDSVGNITAIDEGGDLYTAKIVMEDPYADLLLLEGQGIEGVSVADDVDTHQHMWTMTHGHNMPAHRSDGEALEEQEISVPLSGIQTPEDIVACQSLPKQSPMLTITDRGLTIICVLSERTLSSTAAIQPGSSGGPAFDDQGRLVGIASATDGAFSFWVTLTDIHRFLRSF